MKLKNIEVRKAAYLLALGIGFGSLTMGSNTVTAYAAEEVYVEEDGQTNEVDAGTTVTDNSYVESTTVKEDEYVAPTAEETPAETTNTEKREYGEDEYIDSENWSKDQDIDPNAGDKIELKRGTEAERKGIDLTPDQPTPDTPTPDTPTPDTPTPDTPTPDTPTPETPEPQPVPKMGGNDDAAWLKIFGAATVVGASGYGIFETLRKHKRRSL